MNPHSEQLPPEPIIREFISENLLYSDDGFAYADEASFLQEGIVDSLGVMELVGFTEKMFGIRVDQADVVPENFDSVARLAAFIRRKQRESGQGDAAAEAL